MTQRDPIPAPDDGPVSLTPLDGVDLVAVTPRATRSGLPLAVRVVDGALAGEVASLVCEGSVSATDAAPCPAARVAHHPVGTSSPVRAARALDRLIARARARSEPGR